MSYMSQRGRRHGHTQYLLPVTMPYSIATHGMMRQDYGGGREGMQGRGTQNGTVGYTAGDTGNRTANTTLVGK